MNCLKLSENIIKLRHKKNITQEELAAFLGVTKASVSKWETKQSCPDILLLPQIAAYFDVTIDELLGYELQMSAEQIMKYYEDLAADFAKLPFDEVVEKSRQLMKKYYSCYPLLVQIALLWINHHMLTPDQEKKNLLLKDVVMLCEHILEGCSDVSLCSDAINFKAFALLSLGKADEVIEDIEPLVKSRRFIAQLDPLLIQAYQMVGDMEKAERYNQRIVYQLLLNLIGNSMGMINLRLQDKEFCEETMQRIRKVMDAYDLEHLNPNTALQFHYLAAVFYCMHDQKERALEELALFVTDSLNFIESGLKLHGDDYFSHIEDWFEEFALKKNAPRNEKVVLDSLIPALEQPTLAVLFETEEYQELKKKIERQKLK